jgi:hypothetical protein
MKQINVAVVMTLVGFAYLPGCAEQVPYVGDGGLGWSDAKGGGDGSAVYGDGKATGDGLAQADGWSGTNQPACSGIVYACSDGKDNDGDGLVDALDPECVGPCDDDESSFATGIPGDNKDSCKQDCFFDGNSGQGDDGCTWDLRCDPKNPGASLAKPCPYDPNYKNCPGTQSDFCLKFCLPHTPNGCDCFGCCEVFKDGQSFLIYLGSGPECTIATPEKCAPCTQTTDCNNPCGECELCLGKALADLPAHCFPKPGDGGMAGGDGGSTGTDGGVLLPPCGGGLPSCLSHSDCAAGYYCLTGCCIAELK